MFIPFSKINKLQKQHNSCGKRRILHMFFRLIIKNVASFPDNAFLEIVRFLNMINFKPVGGVGYIGDYDH